MCGPSASHECQRNAAACPGAADAADVPDAADEPCVLGLAEVVQPAAARAAQEMLSAASGAARRERSLLTQYGIGMETILPDRRHAAADHPPGPGLRPGNENSGPCSGTWAATCFAIWAAGRPRLTWLQAGRASLSSFMAFP
jgi:hypothetical protein